ncbi:MAG: hypothetical protein WD850_00520 [Candidatus Spechtbacterales bacterium]
MTDTKFRWPIIVLLLIIALAAFLRLYALSDVPPGIYPDEAMNANDAIDTMVSGEYRVFYPENNGREGLHIWLNALVFQYLGISIFSFKLVYALAGILTIPGIYFLTREFFKFASQSRRPHTNVRFSYLAQELAALFAAGLVATSFWHINFSRIGFRAIFTPLLLTWATYYTMHGLRTKNLFSIVASAVLWGLGYYTYIAFRVSLVIPLFLIGATFLIYLWYHPPSFAPWRTSSFAKASVDRSDGRSRPETLGAWLKKTLITDGWWKWKVWALVLLATLAPLIWTFYRFPQYLSSRSSGISTLASDNPIGQTLLSLGAHLQMFFYMGDCNPRHNFPCEPQMLLPVAALFVLGLAYMVWITYEGVRYRNWYLPVATLTFIGWFLALLSPGFLTNEGLPHALRVVGVIPVVYIIAAFGLLFIIRIAFPHRHHRAATWPFGIGVALVAILLLASFQFTHYFHEWRDHPDVIRSFNAHDVAIGEYFNSLPDDTHRYFIMDADWGVPAPAEILAENNKDGTIPISSQTVLFIQRTENLPVKNTTYLTMDQLPLQPPSPSVFVPLRTDDEELKERLRALYPLGIEEQRGSVYIYRVP